MQKDSTTKQFISLPEKPYRIMIEHCLRKLAGDYFECEACEPKAFGLVGGIKDGQGFTIQSCLPLSLNVRGQKDHRAFMDEIMAEHAIPSETPLENRGWVADPAELMACTRKLREMNCRLIGTYHMHRIPWEHDSARDTPTTLDTILGKNSRLIMFIISMVDPERPLLRAFSEGDIDREIPVQITTENTSRPIP